MPTLVLLPGMHGNAELFPDFTSALGEDVKTIIVSYPEDEPLGYEGLAEFARGYLPKDEPYVVLGESFSGPVAILLAASQPAGLKGVVLCGTFANNPYPYLRPLKFIVPCLPTGPVMTHFAEPFFLGLHSSDALRVAFRHAVSGATPEVMRGRMRSVLDAQYGDKLKSIQAPVLYLRGRQDCVVPPWAMREIAHAIPSLRIAEFDTPHMILQVLPVEAANVVKKFAQECMLPSS